MLLELSCNPFCAAQLALNDAMRRPNASYSREPNAFLVAARSACAACVGSMRIHITVIPVYQVHDVPGTLESTW